MPLIKARSSSIIDSVDLRGTPTAPTASTGANTTQVASTAFVSSAVSDLINSAPAVLDTLSELAAAIADDQNFATTVATSIGTKVALAGDTMTGFLSLHADPSSLMHAATKQYVDGEINAQMIYSTDDVPEGSTNLYYTDLRVRNTLSLSSDNTAVLDYDNTTGIITYNHPLSDGVLEGTTNLYYTDLRVRNAISLTTDDNQILSYGSGVFTFVTPNTDKVVEGATNQYFTTLRARASVSNGSNINYDSATGIISTQAAVWSVNTQTGDVVLDTDDVTEGSTNQYFTAVRAAGAISLTSNDTNVLSYSNGAFTFVKPTTDGILEGSVNEYFTNVRARNALSASGDISYNAATGDFSYSTPTTDGVTEGSTNLYFLDSRARTALSKTTSNASIFDYDSTTGAFTFDLTAMDTDDVAEGSINQYFTTLRARQSISTAGWGNLSYNNGTGVITISAPDTDDVTEGATNQYFTDVRARNAVSATQTSGDGTFSYDNTTGVFTYVGSDDADYRGAVSAVRASGDGDLQYNSGTGVFTYTGPSAANTRLHFSATTSGTGFGNLTYDNTTGVFTYAKVTSADVRGEVSATTATGITYTTGTGVFALASIPNASLANSDITVNGATIALGASATLNADDIAEAVGGTNKYFTEARFDTSLAGKTTDDVAEGANLYYTQGRFDTAFTAKTTTDLAEGTNEYFTQTRARNSLVAGTGVTYTAGTGTIAIGQAVGITDNVTFNDLTVSGDLTVQGTLTAINSTTVEIADVNLTLAKGAATAAAANGAGITIEGPTVPATFLYTSADDSWNVNKNVNVTSVVVSSTVTATQGFVGDLTGDVTGDVDAVNVSVSSLTSGRVTFAGAGGDLVDSSQLTFDSATGELTAFQGDISILTVGNALSVGTLTTTRVPFIGTAGAIIDDARLTYDGTVGGGVLTSTGGFAGDVTGDVTGNLTGNVTGQVSDISNHTTDTLTEGTTNLYATEPRIRAAVSGTNSGTGHGSLSYNSTTGAFTFAKVTSSNIRGEVSATKVSGDGNFSYDSTSGVFSYTGPGPADARAHFSADTATGAAFDQATGIISLANVPNASLANSSITINGATIALGGSDTLDTDDVLEGATNEYFTQTRARNAISLTTSDINTLSYDPATGVFDFDLAGIDTDEVAEGAINQYFTTLRARNSVSATGDLTYNSATGAFDYITPTTDGITEGSVNQYFLDSRARTAISLTTDNSDALSYNTTTGVFSFTLNSVDTNEIAEGATNFYFTTLRARNSISNGSNIDYDATTGVISTQAAVWSVNTQTGDVVLTTDDVTEGSTNKYFSDAQARAAITLTSDDTDVLSYSSGTGVLTFVKPTTDAIAEGAVNLYYTDVRADARIADASIRDLSDVDSVEALQDGYTLVWSSALQKFVPQNIAVTATTLNFTGDGTLTSFSTGVNVTSIDNTQVFINGLIQAPTYSYTLSTVADVTSIVFDQAPETNDYIFVRVSSTSSLTAGGVLNESSNIDGGTY